jgi:glutamate-1-semialdehyde 2,1-aminomutase
MTDPWTTLTWIAAVLTCGIVASLAARGLARRVVTLRAQALTPLGLRHLARWVKRRDLSDEEFYRADGAGPREIQRRRAGIERLSRLFREQYRQSLTWAESIRDSFSDLRFTDANRVPFPFARFVREHFNLASVIDASDGPRVRDLDGNWTLDVSGAYGVNVAGYDRYKTWMRDGLERVADLGPALGPLHPVVADNIAILKSISGLDEVSFHMSGTEAVMAAVRLARFNTRRKLIVCFSGAYHGWWDGVQPGLGSERTIDDCLTLKDLDPASLAVIRRRANEIAGVLVNPVQGFHPNAPPPNDAILLTSDVRKTEDATARYAAWLQRLRAVCSEAGVPLIFDEVYSGFRLAPGGAQEFFGVRADMVVYGKTVAGGLPIGVVCGTHSLMRRFDPDRPMRMSYVVGTFSAHPVVMGSMNEFLRWLTAPGTASLYGELNDRCARWVRATNEQLATESLPLRVEHLTTVWTVVFTEPGRYNWLLQYYLRAEGVTLSWVGTGRCLSNMGMTDKDYDALRDKLVAAARAMRADGWWLSRDDYPEREKTMRTQLIKEMIGSLVQIPRPLQSFYREVMRRKQDDHHASHSDVTNQFLHIVSSSVFLICYVYALWDLPTAMWAGMSALFVRQFGHAILEPPCHDKEATLLGYNTRNKTMILGSFFLLPFATIAITGSWSLDGVRAIAPLIGYQWFGVMAAVVGGRVAYLVFKHGPRLALVWFVKLVTDPITDLIAYSPRYFRPA